MLLVLSDLKTAQNSLRSGNFRVLVRFVIHVLPLCCRMEKMTPDELASYATPNANALHGGDGSSSSSAGGRSPLETHVHQAVNALFLVRNFTMRFVEKQDECSLLAHFNQVTLPDYNAIVSPRGMLSSSPHASLRRLGLMTDCLFK
jgi:hypothetical protein